MENSADLEHNHDRENTRMIFSERKDKSNEEFEVLLKNSYGLIQKQASEDPEYFMHRSALDFEEDVYHVFCEAARNSDFDKTIHLISGHKFPDLVINGFYGVEVKTSRQNNWKSTGNSVLESTRIEDVERIYLFFARLAEPIEFMFRPYQDCLYDVAVTHSPRYLIDMNVEKGDSIFDKIGLSYDELRLSENPIKPIVSYYRDIAKPGEETWWMDVSESPDHIIKPTVTLWSNLTKEEQERLRIKAFARFPEVFGKSTRKKYQRVASWLAARHGIVDSALRDKFSAGGKVDLEVGGRLYNQLPKVFFYLNNYARQIIEAVKEIPLDEIQFYWGLACDPDPEQKIIEWTKMVLQYSGQVIEDSDRFIVHLLGTNFSEEDCPEEIKECFERYGF